MCVGVCVGGCHCHWTASLKKVGVGVCFKGLRNPHKRKPDIRYRYQHHDHDQDQDQDLMFMLLLNLYFNKVGKAINRLSVSIVLST